MKKILIPLMIASLLLASGCSKDNTAKVSDSDKVLIAAPKDNFTKQDLFDVMKQQDYSSIVIGSIAEKIALAEGSTEEELSAAADTTISQYEAIYTTNFEKLVSNYGGLDAFKKVLVRSLATSALADKYIDLNFDKYLTSYSPIKAQIVYFDNLYTVDTFRTRFNKGEDFATLAKELGYSLDAKAQIYTDKDELPVEVKEYINNTDALGLSDNINTATTAKDSEGNATSTPRYYLINIIDRDVNNYKDDFVNYMKNKIDAKEVLNYYFDLYNVTIHDQTTYDLLKDEYTGLKK